jgi:hypothetical protein
MKNFSSQSQAMKGNKEEPYDQDTKQKKHSF